MSKGASTLLALALLQSAWPAPLAAIDQSTITFVHLHTHERLRVPAGSIPAPRTLNRFLRCEADRRYTLFDPRLVVAATRAAWQLGRYEVHVVSAFRTSRLNSAMRAEGHNVALQSRHMHGQALDLRIPGVSVERLCAYFRGLRAFGVGCYARLQFVHIDVGPVRTWSG